jgi:hypothetical protein
MISCGLTNLMISSGDCVRLIILAEDIPPNSYLAGMAGCNSVWAPFYLPICGHATSTPGFSIADDWHTQFVVNDLRDHLVASRLGQHMFGNNHLAEDLDLETMTISDVVSQIQRNRLVAVEGRPLSLMIVHEWAWKTLSTRALGNWPTAPRPDLASVIQQGHNYVRQISARYHPSAHEYADIKQNMFSYLSAGYRLTNWANLGSNFGIYHTLLKEQTVDTQNLDSLIERLAEMLLVAANMDQLNKPWTSLNSVSRAIDDWSGHLWFAREMVKWLEQRILAQTE